MQKQLEDSLRKVIGGYDDIAVLFSGGLDSTLIAKMLKDAKKKFVCYSVGFKGSRDIEFAKRAAKDLGFKLKVIEIKNLEKILKKVVPLIKDPSVLNVSIAIPTFAVIEQAKKDKSKIVLTGLGSDEIFAGYSSHRKAFEKGFKAVEKEVENRIKNVKRDLERDKSIEDYFKIKIETPFLDKKIISFGKKIPTKLKISKNKNKIILRKIGKKIGLPKFVYERKKKAIQYGSGTQKELKKLAKRKGLTLKELVNLYKK